MLMALERAVRICPAAGGNQDALGAHARVLVHQRDRMGAVKHGAFFEELDTGPGKVRPVGGFQAGNLYVLVDRIRG